MSEWETNDGAGGNSGGFEFGASDGLNDTDNFGQNNSSALNDGFNGAGNDFGAQDGADNIDGLPTQAPAQAAEPYVPGPPRLHEWNFKTFGVVIPEVDAENAWEGMRLAAHEPEPDIAKFKQYLIAYAKALKENTEASDANPADIESVMRAENWPLHLIAIARPLRPQFQIAGLDGVDGKTYSLTVQRNSVAPNEKLKTHWPENQENNLKQLASSGFTIASGVKCCNSCGAVGHMRARCPSKEPPKSFYPTCANCEQEGHFARHCTEERKEPGKRKITCRHCEEEGHMARDCPNKPERSGDQTCRKCGEEGHFARECPNAPASGAGGAGGACRKCGEEGHFARECPNAPSGGGPSGGCRKCGEEGHFARECPNAPSGPSGCRNCGEEGHMSRECPLPRDMSRVQCRNCDEMGHTSRECPKPRDYSRVKCNNCGQMGHTVVRCPEPPKPAEDYGTGGAGGYNSTPYDMAALTNAVGAAGTAGFGEEAIGAGLEPAEDWETTGGGVAVGGDEWS